MFGSCTEVSEDCEQGMGCMNTTSPADGMRVFGAPVMRLHQTSSAMLGTPPVRFGPDV